MKKIIWLIIIIIIIIAAVAIFGDNKGGSSSAQGTYSNEDIASGKGRVIVGITDAAADMGSVTNIEVTVESVEVQSSAEGWVEVSDNAQTYDLLALKAENKTELFADAELDAGTYNQIRLNVSDVTVTTDDGEEAEAKLPSGTIKINGTVNVEEQSNTAVTADFLADQSLHVTGNGKFIFAPVVNVKSQSGANVTVDTDNGLSVQGGRVDANITVGMDARGAVKANAKINPNAAVEIGDEGKINVSAGQGASGTVEIGAGASSNSNAGGSAKAKGKGTTSEDAEMEAGAEAEVDAEAGVDASI